MTSMMQSASQGVQSVGSPHVTGPWSTVMSACARIGYVAKGIVFGTIGILATMTALGFAGGRIVGTEGAVQTLGQNDFGRTTLLGIAVGLIAFVIWRFMQAVFDPERKGRDAKGIVQRIGLLISGIAYGSLAAFTLRYLQGLDQPDENGAEEATRGVLAHEWGVWLIGAVAAGFIGVALYQFYRAWSAKFRHKWRRAEMSADEERWAVRLSRIGIAARSVSFLLIGWFLLQAALTSNPEEARGLTGALRAFVDEPWGEYWLGGTGLGLVCYAIYCFVNARYREVPARTA
jgi:hypothetical protein